MKRISLWAWYHPKQAFIAAVILNIILDIVAVVSGFYHGLLFSAIPLWLMNILAFFFLFLTLIHPSKRTRREKRNGKSTEYWFRVNCKFGIYLLAFGMLFAFGTRIQVIGENMPSSRNILTGVVKSPTAQKIVPKTKPSKQERKSFKKQLKKKIKALKEKNNGEKGGLFVIYMVLATLAFFLAFYLAALSCALSCQGQTTLSALAAFGAAGAIVGGVFLIIAGIKLFRK